MLETKSTLSVVLLALLLISSPLHAETFDLQATLEGSQEVPPVTTGATGVAQLSYDDDPMVTTLTVDVTVIGGIELVDLAGSFPFHIHTAAAGANGGRILAVGGGADWQENPPQSGGGIVLSYQMDVSSVPIQNGSTGLDPFGDLGCSDLASCLTIFENALLQEGAYLNLHTTSSPGGEIRGQILPEPAAATGAIAALAALAGLAQRRRRTPTA